MDKPMVLPELKEIVGAMIFGANRPVDVKEIHKCIVQAAEQVGGEAASFRNVKESDVSAALGELVEQIGKGKFGIQLAEVAGGYRFQSLASCGIWLRHLLKIESRNRLSQPALETLAIIAYRQPITRAAIEAIRGVNIDHVIKTLMEMQLVRICGRSDLPGRPFLYGTTKLFLERFGLKDLKDLVTIDPSLFKTRQPAAKAGLAKPDVLLEKSAPPMQEAASEAVSTTEDAAEEEEEEFEDEEDDEEFEEEGDHEVADSDGFQSDGDGSSDEGNDGDDKEKSQ